MWHVQWRVTQHRCMGCSTTDSDVRTGEWWPLPETHLKAASTSSTSTSTSSLSASRRGMFNVSIVKRAKQLQVLPPHWLRRQNWRPLPAWDRFESSEYLLTLESTSWHVPCVWHAVLVWFVQNYNQMNLNSLDGEGCIHEDCVRKICKVNDDLFHRLLMFHRGPT